MTAIGAIAAAVVRTEHRDTPAPCVDRSRALALTTPADTGPWLRPPRRRVCAQFLAQLIAADHQLPQARERRRADPRDAIAAYGRVAAMTSRR